jgi:hypothetical protein
VREHGRPDRPAVVPPPQCVPACRAAFRSEMPDACRPARSLLFRLKAEATRKTEAFRLKAEII